MVVGMIVVTAGCTDTAVAVVAVVYESEMKDDDDLDEHYLKETYSRLPTVVSGIRYTIFVVVEDVTVVVVDTNYNHYNRVPACSLFRSPPA